MNEQPERITILSQKDLDISYFCGSGAGGQARNKVASGVMMRHEESGAIARASDSRSQDQNKRSAFERLLKTPQMKFWIAMKVHEVKMGETVEQAIAKETTEEHLKYEIKREGKWVEVPSSHFQGKEAMVEA
jgi:hypothetical protein